MKKMYKVVSRNALYMNTHTRPNILKLGKYPSHWHLRRDRIKLKKPVASTRWINAAVIGNGTLQNMSGM
jgi:hypothetical protein